MAAFSASVEIDAPPEAVYAIVSDVTRTGEWSPVCRRCEWIEGSSGPEVGARFKGWNQQGPMRWARECKVDEADPANTFAFSTYYRGRESTRWRYDLEPSNGGTTLTQSYEAVSEPLFVKIMGIFMRSKMESDGEKNIRDSLDRIKAIAEREHANA